MPQRVGILTFHDADNYGAVLQAYGLAHAVSTLGHDVEFIDYRPEAARKLYTRRAKNPRVMISQAMRRWRFRSFRKKYLPLSPRRYLTSESLHTDPPSYDCVICGSDQVWNVESYRGFDPTFFLDFLQDIAVTKASYAATFGGARDFGPHREQIASLLNGFQYMSVRDAQSQGVVNELTGRLPLRVLDPSFLTDFTPITPASKETRPYVLAYGMERSSEYEQGIQHVCSRLKLPLIAMGARVPRADVRTTTGPLEWLSLMKNARFVVTNSFHGLCFSLINRKDFYVVSHSKWPSRVLDLLRWMGLERRFLPEPHVLEQTPDAELAIDYSAVERQLSEAQRQSTDYLRGVLRG